MIFYCARLSVCVYKNSLCNVWFFADFFYSLRATWNVASAARLLVCVRMLAQETRRAFVNCQRFENEFIRETRVLLFLLELLLEHFSRSDIIRGEWIRNFDKSFSNGTIVWERAIVYFVHSRSIDRGIVPCYLYLKQDQIAEQIRECSTIGTTERIIDTVRDSDPNSPITNN